MAKFILSQWIGSNNEVQSLLNDMEVENEAKREILAGQKSEFGDVG